MKDFIITSIGFGNTYLASEGQLNTISWKRKSAEEYSGQHIPKMSPSWLKNWERLSQYICNWLVETMAYKQIKKP